MAEIRAYLSVEYGCWTQPARHVSPRDDSRKHEQIMTAQTPVLSGRIAQILRL